MQINSDYILIDDKKSFELSMFNLGNSECIAIDTESSGYYTYYPRVCLIQVTSNGKNYIFDPMSPINLSELGTIFKNPSILKIFHSAIDDIKALKRDFYFEFCNIADTMYSSKLIGHEHNSLEYLVEYYHNTKLSKTEQKSNWERRPLDRQQLKYAALDTAYLETIWAEIKKSLIRYNMLDEAMSEFERFTLDPYKKLEESKAIPWHKFPNILNYSPEVRRNIFDILSFREEKAKKANKAPFRIFNNETIEKIVKEGGSLEYLIGIFGKKDAEKLYHAIKHPSGSPLNKADIPKQDYDLDDEEKSLYKNLRKWREKVMKIRKMDHTMILSNKNLVTLIKSSPKNLDELRELSMMSEWKIRNYGPTLVKIIAKEPYEDTIRELPQVPQVI
ncbi:MAG: HRDC domain-containing protein [Leptospiraceae bacterium]|nr:HRDC domain-containing protein [Leptospiraceae bacterium]MCP5493131.1 HRDC domain-containing protein [Leptospiraceae bacterium]